VLSARPLSSAFASGSGAGDGDREAVLEALIRRASSAWPEVLLDPARFAEYLGRRIDPAELDQARVEDLWIACAAAGGNPAALAVIEVRYLPDLDAALRKMRLSSDRIEEVKQGLRQLLFVGNGESPPRIGDYRGVGDLRSWLRVMAMRAALKLLRKHGRETSSDDALLEARAHEDDPEMAYMKATYRVAFKAAFQEALDSLSAQERTLLKQQIVDGLGIDELGSVYEVHRATAARWVKAVREKLLVRTRRAFILRSGIASDECDSIMAMVRSQLDVSLHRRLAAG
jgi:RNA polymerase sigma-70 factor (ECF subfamily)